MFYDRLLESAGPRRLKRIKTPMEMGSLSHRQGRHIGGPTTANGWIGPTCWLALECSLSEPFYQVGLEH